MKILKSLLPLAFAILLTPPLGATTSPKSATQLYQDGYVQYYVRHNEAAIAEFQQAARLDPTNPMPHLMLSRALMRAGRTPEAAEECKLAVANIQLVPDAQAWLIRSWESRMQAATDQTEGTRGWDEAHRKAETGIALYPDNADLYVLRGELEDNPVKAAPYFIAALNLNPNHPLAQRWTPPNLPLPHIACGPGETVHVSAKPPKLFGGLGQVHHPIDTADPKVRAYFEQGMCCLYAYVYPDAQQAFEAAIKLDPKCAMAYWGLSFSCGGSHLPLPVAEKALSLAKAAGNQNEIWYCTLRVLQLQKRSDEFLYALCGALAHFPKDVDLWVWRATWRGFAGETGDDGRTLA
ncbi:MAG TPA: tetratricopeptide repeat protein, partial [Candidatus Xenobia bacterium]